MNVQVLISALVRQITVLIAQLATSGGARAPLANVANEVFLELAAELEHQGVGRKVSADMFGLALRSYQRKVQRLGESSTVRGQSLWQAIADYLQAQKVATRAQVLRKFHRDDEAIVRSVLHDLTESGLLFRGGAGNRTVYRVATEDELGLLSQVEVESGTDALVWATVYREGPLTRAELRRRLSVAEPKLDESLRRLVDDGRVKRDRRLDLDVYHCNEFLVPLEAPVGWEAAVLDHVQAVVRTICRKLQTIDAGATLEDDVGGSTYTFDVWKGHPLQAEARGTLKRIRTLVGELRSRVEAFNAEHGLPDEYDKVVVYVGQYIIDQTRSGADEAEPTVADDD